MGEKHLFQLEPGSASHTSRLKTVDRKIKAVGAPLDEQLAARAGISVEALYVEYGRHTIAEVDTAINRWGSAFQRHIGETVTSLPPPREEQGVGGWLNEWELERMKEEEEENN